MKSRIVLKLYVVGETAASVKALQNLKAILQDQFKGAYTLTVIDVIKNPQLAEADKILAAPTLIKGFPKPVRKIIGDLSNVQKVLLGLDLVTE